MSEWLVLRLGESGFVKFSLKLFFLNYFFLSYLVFTVRF